MTSNLALRGVITAALAVVVALLIGILLGEGDAPLTGDAVVAMVGAVAGGFIGYLAFRGPANAMSAVSKAASQLARGEFRERVELSSGPSSELTHSFNLMASRLQELFADIGEERARLEAVFEAATEGMLALAEDTTVRFLNGAALAILRTDRESAVGRPFIESARDYELDALVRQTLEGGQEAATRVITFGPERTPLQATAVPIPHGGDWAVLLILSDLTEVQRVDQVRRDFLSNVSHELRTPLASIRAMVETLEDGLDDPEAAREFLERIQRQVGRMTTLVNELLDLSRIESGAIHLEPERVDLVALVGEAGATLRSRAEAEHVEIVWPEAQSVTVEGDRTSLLRVVSNLLDNAIRYSPEGGTVRVDIREEGELVALSVSDQGPGIAPEDLPRVFERFYKVDSSRSVSPGVGLGLAIVKHLVRAHGGTVEAESPPGSGATFIVRLPKSLTVVGRSA